MIKKSSIYILAAILSIGFASSCVDLDVEKQYLADAYISVKVNGADTLYAIESYIESNTNLKSVTMKDPNGANEKELKMLTSGFFEYVGGESSYSKTKPMAGNYTFNVTFDDESSVTTLDNLTSDIIAPIKIKEVAPAESGGAVVVKWEKSTKPNYYSINILNDEKIIFSSGRFDTIYSSATIYTYSGGWATNKNPKPGDTLDVVLVGLLCEKNTSKYTEIQAISKSEKKQVIWPE